MKTVKCKLIGIAPLGFSRPIQSEKESGETFEAYEERTWKERAAVDRDGNLFIAPQNVKNCLVEVAGYLGEKVPGQGNAKFAKHFEAGLMLTEPMLVKHNGKVLQIDDVERDRVFVPSDGRRGGGKRVYKNFPIVKQWEIEVIIHVLDPTLMSDLPRIERYLVHAGQFIGLGWFRPRRNGYYGRFTIHDFKEITEDVGLARTG